MIERKWRSSALGSLVLALGVLLFGCDLGLSQGQPRTALIEITSEAPATIELLTSVDFVTTDDGAVDLLGAEPILTTLPVEQSFDLLDPARILVRVTVPDSTSAVVSMRVFLDGERWYDETESLGVDGRDRMQFLYAFYVPTLSGP